MIAWSKYFHFNAEDVEYIESATDSGKDFPHRLTVHTKSGQAFSVSYKDEKSHNTAKAEMVRQEVCPSCEYVRRRLCRWWSD